MRHTYLLLGLLLAAACQDEKPPQVAVGDAMPNIPLPPNAQMVSREAGSDALKIRLRSSSPTEEVLTYYRDRLSTPPFTLVSDTKAGSSHALYAESPGNPSLWVTISYDSASQATVVDLAGAKGRSNP